MFAEFGMTAAQAATGGYMTPEAAEAAGYMTPEEAEEQARIQAWLMTLPPPLTAAQAEVETARQIAVELANQAALAVQTAAEAVAQADVESRRAALREVQAQTATIQAEMTYEAYSEAFTAAQAIEAPYFEWYDPSTGLMKSTHIDYALSEIDEELPTDFNPFNFEHPGGFPDEIEKFQLAGMSTWSMIALGGVALFMLFGGKSKKKGKG